MHERAARQVMELYPRIFFACHTRHVRDPKTRREISSHQASILDHLDELEPTSLVGLAQHMGVTASTMSLSIDRLARAGYVRRARDESDGRRVNLRLTAAGVRIKEAQSVLDPQRVRSLVGRLTGRERQAAIEGLALLARAARDEMHHKALYGLRRRRTARRGAAAEKER